MVKRKAESAKAKQASSDISDHGTPSKKSRATKKDVDKDNPFPDHKRPNEEECHVSLASKALVGDMAKIRREMSLSHAESPGRLFDWRCRDCPPEFTP